MNSGLATISDPAARDIFMTPSAANSRRIPTFVPQDTRVIHCARPRDGSHGSWPHTPHSEPLWWSRRLGGLNVA